MRYFPFVLIVPIFCILTQQSWAENLRISLMYATLDSNSFLPNRDGGYSQVRLSDDVPNVETLQRVGTMDLKAATIEFNDSGRSILVVWPQNENKVYIIEDEVGEPSILNLIPGKAMGKDALCGIKEVNVSFSNSKVMKVLVEIKIIPDNNRLLFRQFDYRLGKVTLNREVRQIALTRNSKNLTFDGSKNTLLFIDQDRDETGSMIAFIDSLGGIHEREIYSADEPFVIDGEAYELAEVSKDGSQITLRPSTRKVYFALHFQAPDLSMQTLEDEQMRLNEFSGKVVVINWWATWCGPCIQEMPELNKLVAKFPSEEVVFIAIAQNTKAEVRKFLEKHKFDYRLALYNDEVQDHLGEAFPRHIVMNQEGRIVLDLKGVSSYTLKALDSTIGSLIAGQ